MLDAETKRRIDTARDILVGKVPDPKSQVEQITIALIYKFMDDMDAEAEEMGGARSFFAGEFAKYGWAKLMGAGLGGYEVLNLYAEAITRMNENPGVPALFRDIFKNAYLPYRDPETLHSFLKIINDFTYEHSEQLGDAFEYLLSVLGSQGEAGQFRTPRHIIDFMVDLIDPQKGDSILDPACGTAGFLISAYKHILAANAQDGRPSARLAPDERARLIQNIRGYDISPDMVRLSLVNLYLHGFTAPHIAEYDTLTSDERWNEYADVIMANPPFMSPKGGIRPHKRFAVPSNRSEVLFVDYIAEHLTANGRAAVVVPEGVIFQTGTAYKSLRKLLVDAGYLVGVISLPAGVFNPYSGVKTSILWLDKTLAKKSDGILFAKIQAEGFDLGAQRRPVKQNDLPDALQAITEYKAHLASGQAFEPDDYANVTLVEKARVAENGEYSLSGERYKLSSHVNMRYDVTTLGEVITGKPEYGSGAKKQDFDGEVRYIRITDIDDDGKLRYDEIVSPSVIEPQYFLREGDVLFARSGSVGRCYIHREKNGKYQYAGYLIRFNIDRDKAIPDYIFYLTKSEQYQNWIDTIKKSGTLSNINAQEYSSFSFPLPPLDVQAQIVAEIGGYQKIIDGARQVLEHYSPRIEIDPAWPVVKLGELGEIVRGSSPRPKSNPKYYGGSVPRLMVADITRDGMYTTPQIDSLTEEGAKQSRPMKKGSVIITVSGNPGLPTILAVDACIHDGFAGLRDLDESRITPSFLYHMLLEKKEAHGSQSVGAVFQNLTTDQLRQFDIPLPDLAAQKRIVAQVEREQALVRTNRELVELFEGKIKARIAKVWGEE